MRHSLITFIFFLIACSTSPGVDELSAIPHVSALGCCWQATEKISISRDGQQRMQVMSITAVTPKGLILVILDPLQQRWLTITQQGRKVVVDKASEGPEAKEDKEVLPIDLLVLGIYLQNADASDWLGSSWQVRASADSKMLSQNGKVLIRLKTRQSTEDNIIDIYYPSLDIDVAVTTTSKVLL